MAKCNKFKAGDRIRVADTYFWAQGATGTITKPPIFAQQLVADQEPWQGLIHREKCIHKIIESYWVWFDEPQPDGSGDGPYKGGEIETESIELL